MLATVMALYNAAGLTSPAPLYGGKRTEAALSTDDPDSVPEAQHRGQYRPGDPVWVGQSRGSEREGTVLRHLGEGFYSVSVAGEEGVRTIHEGLLHPRQETDEEG